MKITFHENTRRLYLTAQTAEEHYILGSLTVTVGPADCAMSTDTEKNITLSVPIERLIAEAVKPKG